MVGIRGGACSGVSGSLPRGTDAAPDAAVGSHDEIGEEPSRQFRQPRGSIPRVAFVVFDSVTRQQQPEFLLKRPFPVVLLLGGNVRLHFRNVRLAYRKRPVSVLPVEAPQRGPYPLDAHGRAGFDLLHQLGNRDRAVQITEDVYVVLCRADDERGTLDVPQDPRHVAQVQ